MGKIISLSDYHQLLKNNYAELYGIKPNIMKAPQTAIVRNRKDSTNKILVIGFVILILQMAFHLTFGY